MKRRGILAAIAALFAGPAVPHPNSGARVDRPFDSFIVVWEASFPPAGGYRVIKDRVFHWPAGTEIFVRGDECIAFIGCTFRGKVDFWPCRPYDVYLSDCVFVGDEAVAFYERVFPT